LILLVGGDDEISWQNKHDEWQARFAQEDLTHFDYLGFIKDHQHESMFVGAPTVFDQVGVFAELATGPADRRPTMQTRSV
jgi:hypothetical protein